MVGELDVLGIVSRRLTDLPGSELQRRDVRGLLDESVDFDYIERWAAVLGVQALLRELRS